MVDIVHFDRSENQPTHKMTFGFYALFLKKTVGCTINYGKTKYDLDDETVKSETGKTAREHIHIKIIEMAKNALLEPDASIKQIADMLGFQ